MPNEFDINNLRQYVNKNLALEASAGTGKTYSIQKIVRELVENNIDIKEILIVTYTEKATGELKNRIRNELLNCSMVKKEDLDNLNIFTIHSFCQNAIKEFGLEANQPFDLIAIDEPKMLSEFLDKYIRDNDDIREDVSFAICKSNEKYSFSANSFKETIINVLSKYYLDYNNKIDKNIISLKDSTSSCIFDIIKKGNGISLNAFLNDDKFKENYDILNNCSIDEIKLFINKIKKTFSEGNIPDTNQINFSKDCNFDDIEEQLIETLYTYKNKTINSENNDFNEMLNNDDDLNNIYNTLKLSSNPASRIIAKSIEAKSNYMPRKRVFKIDFSKQLNIECKNTYPDNINTAITYFSNFSKDAKNFSFKDVLIYNYIDKIYLEWQKEKEKNKQQSFNDMLRTIRENLLYGNVLFKDKLKEKYIYAIIDEFQDTNQLQFDTFKSIFLDDSRHIIVVGDPKQSIYSFQGADLNVYKKAINDLNNNYNTELLKLSTNYRSSDLMVDSCNKLFSTIEEKAFFDNGIFEPSNPCQKIKNAIYDNNLNTSAVWVGIKSQEDGKINPIEPSEYAKLVSQKIIECCEIVNNETRLQVYDKDKEEYRNVSFKDFAILSKSRSEAIYIERELKNIGIPYIKYKDTGLFNTDECIHWASILDAIDAIDFTGNNRKLFKRALFTEFFGRSLEEINYKYFNKDDNDEIKLINKWKEIARNHEWEKLIDSIMIDSNLYARLKSLNKLQSFILFKQLGDYCISYLYDNHTLSDLVYRLKNSSSDDDDADAGIVETGTDFDAVKIMTIHASKGLQYPVVISAAGFKTPKKSGPYIYHEEDNGIIQRKISFDSSDSKKDELEEFQRLMYVCFTRAESLMIIPFYAIENTKEGKTPNEWLNERTKLFIDNCKLFYSPITIDNSIYSTLSTKITSILGDAISDDTEYQTLSGLSNKKAYKNSYSSLSKPKGKKNEDPNMPAYSEPDKNRDNEHEKINVSEFDSKDIVRIETLITNDSHIPYDNIPKGATIGTALHEVFEKIDFKRYDNNLEDIIKERLKANRIEIKNERVKYIEDIVANVLNAELPEINGAIQTGKLFHLNEIPTKDKKTEIEFNFNIEGQQLKNYCNGFIDLLFKRGKYFSILDWKSDTLNDDFIAYNDYKSLENHTDEHYSIQRVLYSYCLIKWLKTYYPDEEEEDIFNNHFGGIYYVYIRGCKENSGNGIYAHTWKNYDALKNAFELIIEKKRIGGK